MGSSPLTVKQQRVDRALDIIEQIVAADPAVWVRIQALVVCTALAIALATGDTLGITPFIVRTSHYWALFAGFIAGLQLGAMLTAWVPVERIASVSSGLFFGALGVTVLADASGWLGIGISLFSFWCFLPALRHLFKISDAS